MGGHIWVVSAPGEGSTFGFRIPVDRAPQTIARPHVHGDRRILVACADPDRARDIQRAAHTLDAGSEVIGNAHALRRRLQQQNRPHLLVLDSDLPGFSPDDWSDDDQALLPPTVLLASLGRHVAGAEEWAATVLVEPVRESRMNATLAALIHAGPGSPQTSRHANTRGHVHS